MSKKRSKNIIEIIPNSKTVILCTNNVDKYSLANCFKNDTSLIISSKTQELTDISICNSLVKALKIKDLLNYDFNTLSIGEKQMLQMCYAISTDKDIIVNIDSISNVSSIEKVKIFKFLNKSKKTIIYITSNKEDIVYFDQVILFDEEVILNDKLDNVIDKEQEFRDAGFTLPFMPLLSLKLKYYNLVEKPILSMNRMVNKLWK